MFSPAEVTLATKVELFDPTDWFFDAAILDEDFAWDMLEELDGQTYHYSSAKDQLDSASFVAMTPLVTQRMAEVQAAWFNPYYTISGWLDMMAEFNKEMLEEAPDVVDEVADLMDFCWEIEIFEIV